jgi:hypothetical protein
MDKCHFYCRCCDVAVPVDTMLDIHFKSKKHLLNTYDFKIQPPVQYSDIITEYIYEINNGIPPR